MEQLKKEVKAGTTETGRLVDVTFFAKKALEALKNATSDLNTLIDLSIKVAVARWKVDAVAAGDRAEKSIRGEYAIGTPDVSVGAYMVKHDHADFPALVKYVMEHEDLGPKAVRLHWPSMSDHVSELTREGKPVPPGVDLHASYDRYTMACAAKKGVNIDDLT